MKAVIVEIKGKHAAVLAENGVVSKIRNKNYELGQEIVLNNNKGRLIRMTAAAAAAIMIFVTPAWAYLTPYSYVSLDVNPSFEFFINRFDRVLTVKAFNDDGNQMSKDINIAGLKNKEIQTAVKTVLNELKNKGYINEDERDGVIVAASSKSEKKTGMLSEKIRAAVSEEIAAQEPENKDKILREETETKPETVEITNNNETGKPKEQVKPQGQAKPDDQAKSQGQVKPEKSEKPEKQEKPDKQEKSDQEKWEGREKPGQDKKEERPEQDKENKQDRKKLDVKVIEVTEKEVNEAKKKGITPGKLNLIEKLQEAAKLAGHKINPDDWFDKSVHEINEKIKDYKEEIKQKEKYDKDKNKNNNKNNNKNSRNDDDRDDRDGRFDFNNGRDRRRD
ncbi:MAG TPA: hypothetical protein PLF27_10835 [Sedimentibacter sp.]|nr:hypothetical protein [Sedimentibacter sp.]